MSKNLFVGNLAWETTDEDLRELFAPIGSVVRAQVVMDRMTGRSRGFGFVEMESEAQAEAAIANMNGQEFLGRPLIVNSARPRPDRGRGSARRGHDGGGYVGGRQDRS